jgi:hypothetical protein
MRKMREDGLRKGVFSRHFEEQRSKVEDVVASVTEGDGTRRD